MTALALPAPRPLPLVAELLARQRTLGLFGLALLGFAVTAAAMQALDPRMLASGVNVWVKPAKFFSSVALLSLTLAWFFGYVAPERRRSFMLRTAVATVLVAGSLELAWISWQAANGLESHFNFDTPFYRLMFNLMGLFAVLLLATTLPLAWAVARHPAPGLTGDFRAAVAGGLVLAFLLGTVFGALIATNGGHAVGPYGGAVPVFGWNRSGGDLRIAHFAGIHAMQALPILAALAAGLAARLRWTILLAGTALYVALAVGLYAQAAAGRPLWPL